MSKRKFQRLTEGTGMLLHLLRTGDDEGKSGENRNKKVSKKIEGEGTNATSTSSSTTEKETIDKSDKDESGKAAEMTTDCVALLPLSENVAVANRIDEGNNLIVGEDHSELSEVDPVPNIPYPKPTAATSGSQESSARLDSQLSLNSKGVEVDLEFMKKLESKFGAEIPEEFRNALQPSDNSVQPENPVKFEPKLPEIDYNFSNNTELLCIRKLYSAGEISSSLWDHNNYLKGCKWSPDGSCLLTNSEDRYLRVLTFSADLFDMLYNGKVPEKSLSEDEVTVLSSVRAGDLVYDFCWFPKMHSALPETCLYATTSRSQPVHLRDACSGKLAGTYQPINHLDELSPAHSLCFSRDGRKLYTGANKVIRIFNVSRPGRESQAISAKVKKQAAQAGIISCITVAPHGAKTYAAGSYNRTVGIYTEDTKHMQCMFQGHKGGITHLKFSSDGNYLFSGARKDSEIVCWDMRNPGQVVSSFRRQVDTNQRVYFDTDAHDRFLVSGEGGSVKMWDISCPPQRDADMGSEIDVQSTWRAHSSLINGVSLNPALPVLATASGQRIFPLPLVDESDTSDNNSDDDSSDLLLNATNTRPAVDNTLRLWYLK